MREKRKKTKKGLVHGYAMYKVITTQVVQTFTVILLATQKSHESSHPFCEA